MQVWHKFAKRVWFKYGEGEYGKQKRTISNENGRRGNGDTSLIRNDRVREKTQEQQTFDRRRDSRKVEGNGISNETIRRTIQGFRFAVSRVGYNRSLWNNNGDDTRRSGILGEISKRASIRARRLTKYLKYK